MRTAKEAVGVQAVPLPSAEVACWVQEMICRVLGEPPGTVHLAYSAAEWNKLKRGGKNSPYDAIRRGEIPIIPGTGRAVRIPAAWVHAQLGQQVRCRRRAGDCSAA
jgi:hypothetical protein